MSAVQKRATRTIVAVLICFFSYLAIGNILDQKLSNPPAVNKPFQFGRCAQIIEKIARFFGCLQRQDSVKKLRLRDLSQSDSVSPSVHLASILFHCDSDLIR